MPPWLNKPLTLLVIVAAVFAVWTRITTEPPEVPPPEKIQAALAVCLPEIEIPTAATFTLTGPIASSGSDENRHVEVASLTPITLETSRELGEVGTSVALEGWPLSIKKAAGDFEIRTLNNAVIKSSTGATLLVIGGATFSPKGDVIYRITGASGLTAKIVVGSDSLKRLRIAGTTHIGNITTLPITAVANQPLRTKPWLVEARPMPPFTRSSGSDNLLRMSATGIESLFSTSLAACAANELSSESMSSKTSANVPGNLLALPAMTRWKSVAVSTSSNDARMAVDLPPSMDNGSFFHPREVWIAVTTSDGKFISIGTISLIGKGLSASIASIIVVASLWVLMRYRGLSRQKKRLDARWLSGLFTGPDNEPSLSLLQMLFWTTITCWGIFYVFIVVGSLLTMTQEMMWLLGIAGAGSVFSRLITNMSNNTISSPTEVVRNSQNTVQKDYGPADEFWKMLSTNGRFDLLKLQLFAFTVVIGTYVIGQILKNATFPNLDTNTLLLLGVSQGIYVSSKLASSTPMTKAQAIKTDIDLAQDSIAVLSKQVELLNDDKTSLTQQKVTLESTGAGVGDINAQIANATASAEKVQKQLDSEKSRLAQLSVEYDKVLTVLGLKRS